MYAADERAHRRPGDAHNLIAAAAKFVDHPDMGVAPCAAAAQRKGNSSAGNQQPPSLAARTATITADCCAVESLPQVELNVTGLATVDACTSFSSDSTWP